MPVRNSYRRAGVSRGATNPRWNLLLHLPSLLADPGSRSILVLRQPHLPYPRFCTAMRQSLIKFNNFCAAHACSPYEADFPPPPSSVLHYLLFSFLLLYFSCPAVYLRSTVESLLSTSLFRSLRHVINLHLSQRNHWVPQIYDGDMPDLLKRPRFTRDSIFNDTLARLFAFSLPFYFGHPPFRKFCRWPQRTFPKLFVDMVVLVIK